MTKRNEQAEKPEARRGFWARHLNLSATPAKPPRTESSRDTGWSLGSLFSDSGGGDSGGGGCDGGGGGGD